MPTQNTTTVMTCTPNNKQSTNKLLETTKRSSRSIKTLASDNRVRELAAPGKRKRVTFKRELLVTVKQSPSFDEYDPSDTWYSVKDYDLFEQECVRTIQAFRKAHSLRLQGKPHAEFCLDTTEFTAKGLEYQLSKQQKQRRDARKERHRVGVLMEQQEQRVLGICAEELAAVSQLLSSESRAIALRKGTPKAY